MTARDYFVVGKQTGCTVSLIVGGCLLFVYLKLRPSERRVRRWRRKAEVILTHIREPRSFKYYAMEWERFLSWLMPHHIRYIMWSCCCHVFPAYYGLEMGYRDDYKTCDENLSTYMKVQGGLSAGRIVIFSCMGNSRRISTRAWEAGEKVSSEAFGSPPPSPSFGLST